MPVLNIELINFSKKGPSLGFRHFVYGRGLLYNPDMYGSRKFVREGVRREIYVIRGRGCSGTIFDMISICYDVKLRN